MVIMTMHLSKGVLVIKDGHYDHVPPRGPFSEMVIMTMHLPEGVLVIKDGHYDHAPLRGHFGH